MSVAFKVDENLPSEASERLSAAGYNAVTVLEQRLQGTPDANLSEVCRAEQRAILTLDLDFSDIRTYPPGSSPGIVVLRVSRQDKQSVLRVVDRLISALANATPEKALWIVDEEKIRIRV